MKVNKRMLSEAVRRVRKVLQEQEEQPAQEEQPETTQSTTAKADQMSPEQAREMAAAVFDGISAGRVANVKSSLATLQNTASGRIALAVQALMRYGNADPEEINSIAGIIRKVASSPAE